MKPIITILFLSFILPCAAFQSPSYFDSELSRISRDFRESILDEYECDNLKNYAEDIVDEIETLLEDESDDYSIEDVLELKELKQEAEGIEDFIAVVGGVGTHFPNLKNFMAANERIGARIFYISRKKFCIDILLVEIGEYRAYLASNSSSKNLSLQFEWNSKDRSAYGDSKSGMVGKSIRHMLNNRDSLDENNIEFRNIICQEF